MALCHFSHTADGPIAEANDVPHCGVSPTDFASSLSWLSKNSRSKGGSPGLVVMGGHSRSEGCGFES